MTTCSFSFDAHVAAAGTPSALRLDSASEKAVTLLRRPVVVKVDEPGCEGCGALDQFWDMAGAALPPGSIWRVDCGESGDGSARRFALCEEGRLTGRPRFEAWDGDAFLPYSGWNELEALRDWVFQSLKPTREANRPTDDAAADATEPQSMGTLFVSPSVQAQGGHAVDHKIDFGQFQKYSSAYPALVRALAPYVEEAGSIVDVGCGHGMLVEAWRAGHTNSSYGVEGSSDVVHTWPREYVDEFYRVQDLTDADATLPPTGFVQTFEVAEHLPEEHAGHFVRMLTHHRPRLVFFGAATVDQDQGRNPLHVNENTMGYWVEKFGAEGYALDAARSAEARVALLADTGYQRALQTGKAWWYVKNALIFANTAAVGREALDTALANAPESAVAGHFARLYRTEDEAAAVGRAVAMLYETMYDGGPIGPMWHRDWEEFSSLYTAERNTALARVRARAVGTAEEVGGGAKLAGNDTGALKMKKNETKTLENDDLAATQMTQQQQRIHARNQLEGHLRSLKNQLKATTAAIDAGVEWLDQNQEADADQFEAQQKAVNDVVTPLIAGFYTDVGGGADTDGSKDGSGDGDGQVHHQEL